MYRISCVKYINSLPFISGLEKHPVRKKSMISLDTPAECYNKLLTGLVDIGLVPVVALRKLEKKYIISPYCIGTRGQVNSVLMASDTPLKKIEKIYLDYQSRTSVELTRVLCREFWEIEPEFIPAKPGFVKDKIPEKSAYVVIGDRAFPFHQSSYHIYDLGEEWIKYSSKPFVFACWVSNKLIDQEFISEFSEALKSGLDHRNELVEDLAKEHPELNTDFHEYFYHHINYNFDSDSVEGMELFLNLLQ